MVRSCPTLKHWDHSKARRLPSAAPARMLKKVGCGFDHRPGVELVISGRRTLLMSFRLAGQNGWLGTAPPALGGPTSPAPRQPPRECRKKLATISDRREGKFLVFSRRRRAV
jgi:hypothetical protein